MIVTTGNDVAGREISKYLGIVRGIVVRSPSIAQGFLGGLKQIVGGNIEAYAQVCETAREEAWVIGLLSTGKGSQKLPGDQEAAQDEEKVDAHPPEAHEPAFIRHEVEQAAVIDHHPDDRESPDQIQAGQARRA